MEIANIIARSLGLRPAQVAATVRLIDEGATIPFISRYRKEVTGGLDEVQVGKVKEENERLAELAHRREFILKTIEGQGKLTEELRCASRRVGTKHSLKIFICLTSPNGKHGQKLHETRGCRLWLTL